MSRIRSVHPGFFKDERLVPCSAFARLLFIGLGVESDDKGIFEWKPVTLKMTVFPGDNVDVAALLEELIAADAIMQFEHNDRAYGAIRNFRKYQKPKTPNSVHPMPDYVADYVAFPKSGENTDSDRRAFPRNGEKSPQMEDGGGRVEDEDTSSPPVLVAEAQGARDLFDDVWDVFPQNPTSIRGEARKRFDALPAKDQVKAHEAAQRYARWFAEDCINRKRTVDAGLRYVPHLATWIETGAWRQADALPIKAESQQPVIPVTKLDRERDRDLWLACEKVMGKKAPTSNNEWWFKDAVIAEARQQAGESVH